MSPPDCADQAARLIQLLGFDGDELRRVLDVDLGDFMRVCAGEERPPTTDPDRVAAYVVSRFGEPPEEVFATAERAADAVEEVVRGQAEGARR